ncbi:WD40 repeat domain-containing protein [Kitasatospora atroaurantiaca]|uniref:WD40 repeat protein n=1 Tax=Kitasatospora atroaurantiaca TaxID=285545 RepID=A0A561EI84_9ACTN|nr:hypothetical protein [Kitasatospora atroaurantiaca]TWE15325.1 hypothetical protein FB465_0217 [Kitasatospora atroaurantiaca]
MRLCSRLLVALLLVLGPTALPAAAADGSRVEFTMSDPRITESSGLAASSAHPGVYWTHNDSDDGPYVYAVDSQGRTVATVTLRGVKPRDVEAIALGPDRQLYLADIGDNFDGAWPEVWIYRFDEPEQLRDQTVDAVRYRVRYEDGPRNAEAVMVHPVTGRVYIASKREKGGGLYQGPETLSESGTNTFRKIAEVPWVTDGAFSPDGSRLVLRGYFWANVYRWKDGLPQLLGPSNPPLQRQGESVTFSSDGRSLLFGSEGKSSSVWRVPLRGEQLPDNAQETATPVPTSSRAPEAGAGGSAAKSPESTKPGKAVTLLLVVAGVAVVAGLRKKRRTG